MTIKKSPRHISKENFEGTRRKKTIPNVDEPNKDRTNFEMHREKDLEQER